MTDQPIILTTRTGLRFQVRPAVPQDDAALKAFFTHVTPADLRFRFLTAIRSVGDQQIAMLTHPDHDHAESFVVFNEQGDTLIATAMLACDDACDHGEVAIVIREDQKHQGVSWELLAHVARYAEAKGVRVLESIESRDNHEAIELERDMGFVVSPYPGDATLVLVSRILQSA